METRVCHICGKSYNRVPAISRIDNKTRICPACGIRQSLSSLGISESEQNKIIKNVEKYERKIK